eukprot:4721627-Pyramimonas_sp.AAC.1
MSSKGTTVDWTSSCTVHPRSSCRAPEGERAGGGPIAAAAAYTRRCTTTCGARPSPGCETEDPRSPPAKSLRV